MAAQQWEKTLRRQIKDNHGFGWNLIEQSGKTKLTRVHLVVIAIARKSENGFL